MKKILIILLFIPFSIFPEVQLGSITALIYENYDEPNLILNSEGVTNDFSSISKVLTSLTTQFIWKDQRNMLILNLEFFGTMGSLDGSFGKEGKLDGQLKADSFYRGFFRETPVYFKFGKYPTSLPYSFGTEVTSGQVEVGYNSDWLNIFYSGTFYSLFNTLNDDSSYEFNSETYLDDNVIINLLAADMTIKNNRIKLRLPVEYSNSNLFSSLYPSISHNIKWNNLTLDSFVGLATRSSEYNLGIREEISIDYLDFTTYILGAYLTENSNSDKSYNYTSVDNTNLEFHYGSHFNYLYHQAGNIYGLTSIGLKQTWTKDDISLWVSSSQHLTVNNFTEENRENTFIGSIFSGGFKWNNLWSENTLFEIYLSVLKPEGFSIINDTQTRDLGFQLVIKLQHIIF